MKDIREFVKQKSSYAPRFGDPELIGTLKITSSTAYLVGQYKTQHH